MKNNNFLGFDDYIPIFSGGKQIDSHGLEHDGDELIDQAVTSFAPETHEPPVVVGHPKDNSPAFGWVESVKKIIQTLKDGTKINVLMAKFKNVVPEFAQAVQQGLYKKRSASFYPDGRLRHVGFLGGMPPAVKGLADIGFNVADGAFEFEEMEPINFMEGWWGLEKASTLFRSLRDFFIEKFGKDEADKVLPSYDIDSISNSADQLSRIELPQTAEIPLYSEGGNRMPKTFTEEELQAQIKAERDKITAEKNAEFAEKTKLAEDTAKAVQQKETDMAKLLADAKKAGEDAAKVEFAEQCRKDQEVSRKKEIAEFISSGIKTGKILPAWQKMGLTQFMEGLGAEQAVNFGETTGEKTPYEFFKVFMAALPKVIDFGEFATRVKNVGGMGSAGAQLNDLTTKKMKENPKLDFTAAFSEVQLENLDLVREYEQEFRGKSN